MWYYCNWKYLSRYKINKKYLNMRKTKNPPTSDQDKINEVMELMDKYGIRIAKAICADNIDLVLSINSEHYAITNTDTFPPVFDDGFEFVKSNLYGQIYFYNNEGNIENIEN